MEFVDLSRYLSIKNPGILPFSELRKMDPVWMTQDIQIVDEPDNSSYVESLAKQGIAVVPIRRRPPFATYLNRTSFPRRVLFEMTSICNAKCRMCPQMNLKRKLIHMDKDKYKNVVDELDRHGLEGFWLYHFGESLIHPNFREIMAHVGLKRNLGYIWLSTNGICLDEKVTDFLLKSSLSFLNFSLQSISVENYRKIAPSSPAEKILANLQTLILRKQNLLGTKPFFRLQIIEQEDTVDEIDTYLRQFHDKCDIISVNMLEHTNLDFNKAGSRLREHKKRTKCSRIIRSDCFINSDGSVALCDNAYNNELDVGNVWDKSVYDIWNGPERQRILKMNEDGSLWNVPICSECTDYDL